MPGQCQSSDLSDPFAEVITDHPFNNVTENIFAKLGANLHRRPDHPICIIKEAIYSFFDERRPGVYAKLDDLYPVVSAKAVSVCSLCSGPLTIYKQPDVCSSSDSTVSGT